MVCWGHRDEKSKKFKKYDAYAKRQFRLSLKHITGQNLRRPQKIKKKKLNYYKFKIFKISKLFVSILLFLIKNPEILILLGDFVLKKAPGWLNLQEMALFLRFYLLEIKIFYKSPLSVENKFVTNVSSVITT